MMQDSPFSAHKDVLEAPIPVDSISRTVLLSELKSRAKLAVGGQSWSDARALYEKAIQVALAHNNNKNETAICYSNLSLVQGKMNYWHEAKLSATNATATDPTYVKGWWRLGQAHAALADYTQALRAFESALAAEPNNKALQKEMEKTRGLLAQQQSNKTNTSSIIDSAKREPAPPRSAMSGTFAQTKLSSSSETTVIDLEGTEFSASEVTKGYKIVNGKKTSYFHNELSEDVKHLIGDIAPKKIDAVNSANLPETVAANGVASVWNQAGTWEEKDVSNWACAELKCGMETCRFAGPVDVTVQSATVTGSASIAQVRGKKRYIYELVVEVTWTAAGVGDGKMTFPDIDGTCIVGEPYDISGFEIVTCEHDAQRPLLEEHVRKGGLRKVMEQAIDEWVQKFQETY
jgi:hypothetical protein